MISLHDLKLKFSTENKSIAGGPNASFLWHLWLSAKRFEMLIQIVHSRALEATYKNQQLACSISGERPGDGRNEGHNPECFAFINCY